MCRRLSPRWRMRRARANPHPFRSPDQNFLNLNASSAPQRAGWPDGWIPGIRRLLN
jgi:hypothetical protein